jgi:hypothetical protein
MTNPILTHVPDPTSSTPVADLYASVEMKLRYASPEVIHEALIEPVTNMTIADVAPLAEVFERLFAERAEGHGKAQRDLFYGTFEELFRSFLVNVGLLASKVSDKAEAEATRRLAFPSMKLIGPWLKENGRD